MPLFHAQDIATSLKAAAEHGWMTPSSTVEAVATALAEPDEIWVFKLALQARDDLREMLASRPDAAAAWRAAPQSTGHPEWDTFLATLAAHEFIEAGWEPPTWTQGPPLQTPWILDSPLLDESGVRAQTPEWLAERNIYVSARDLTTV